jgi:hypothetical protein
MTLWNVGGVAGGHLAIRHLKNRIGPEQRDVSGRHGIPGERVASSTRPDSQATSAGEFLRSRVVEAPEALLDEG